MFSFLTKNKEGNLVDFFVSYAENKSAMTDLALEVGIARIADVIAKCGFICAGPNDSENPDILYQMNVKPNANQSATDFWRKAIYKMIRDDEGCVVVNLNSARNQGIFIAETFNTDNGVMKDLNYSNVCIDVYGNTMMLSRKFKASDVVHLRYSNPRLLSLLRQNASLLDAAYSVAVNGFKAKAPKTKVSFNAGANARIIDSSTGKPITSNQYADQIAKDLTSEEAKGIIANSGIDIQVIDMKSSLSSDDIKKIREEAFQNVASVLGIPISIMYGNPTSGSVDDFLTLACDPVIATINCSINGAWLDREEYIAGKRILVNNVCMKHVDLIDSAGNLDKLYQNGWSHNDILKAIGHPTIDEEWANKRRWTKNYSEDMEGGETE